jgi:signal transduction histidine kinase
MTEHGIEHNREIAERLHPLLAPRIQSGADVASKPLQDAVTLYGTFGYRIVLLDGKSRLLADSHRQSFLPEGLMQSWLADVRAIDGRGTPGLLEAGAASATAEDGHTMLIWLAKIEQDRTEGTDWYLAVASDQQNLNEFLGELHWHLDGVLLVTYLLVGLLGVLAMRSIGRAYERKLEADVRQRTLALDAAHEQILTKTRLETIGQTAAVLAHEMRNPLASIKLAVSGLRNQEGIPDRTRRRFELVEGEVDRLELLLSQTLDFARPVKLSPGPVLLDQIVSRVIEQQQPVLDERGITVRRRECNGCVAIRLDEDKVYQALLNLLKNAIEASPDGAELGVNLSANAKEEAVLEIENVGDAVDAEILRRAFEPFYTTKPRGSGLGLGLVRRIIEEHGGSVTLTSESAGMTRATVILPMVDTAKEG